MARILVSGYYGFNNAGDEAILGGIINAVANLNPDVTFTVISGDGPATAALHGVNAINRDDYDAIWKAMARTDLLISGGGSLLQDVTGVRTIPYYLGIASMGKMRGLPVMFYAQGIGPVTTIVGRGLLPAIGNHVDLITVRDEQSAWTLKELGIQKPHISLTADAALALGPADPELGRPILQQFGVQFDGRPVVGVAMREWKGSGAMKRALAAGLDRLVLEQNASVLLIPMQQPQDTMTARRVNALMTQPATVLEGDFSYRQLQSLFGCCDVVVGMRYHALVFSAMAGVPIVGLSYDPKNDSFLDLLGQEAIGTAQKLDADLLTAAVIDTLQRADAIRAHYDAVIGMLTPLSMDNARLAFELLR